MEVETYHLERARKSQVDNRVVRKLHSHGHYLPGDGRIDRRVAVPCQRVDMVKDLAISV